MVTDEMVTEYMMRLRGVLFQPTGTMPFYWHKAGDFTWNVRVADMSSIRFVSAGCVPIASTSCTVAKENRYARAD